MIKTPDRRLHKWEYWNSIFHPLNISTSSDLWSPSHCRTRMWRFRQSCSRISPKTFVRWWLCLDMSKRERTSAPGLTTVRCPDKRWSAVPASCTFHYSWTVRRLQPCRVDFLECIRCLAGQGGSTVPLSMSAMAETTHRMAGRPTLRVLSSHDQVDRKRQHVHRLLCWLLRHEVLSHFLMVGSKLLHIRRLWTNLLAKEIVINPWNILSQIGIEELQLPLARQTISGVPIKALPLLHENWTLDPIWVAVVLKANPRRGVISPQCTAFTSTTTACAWRAGVMQE